MEISLAKMSTYLSTINVQRDENGGGKGTAWQTACKSVFISAYRIRKYIYDTSLKTFTRKSDSDLIWYFDAYLRRLRSDFFFHCLYNPFTDIANTKVLFLTTHIKDTDEHQH